MTASSRTGSVQAAEVEADLRLALAVTWLRVDDDSHLHAGHAGAASGRHFSVTIVSTAFANLTRVRRHRLVYDALAPLMQSGIHALAIHARTPDEALSAPNSEVTPT